LAAAGIHIMPHDELPPADREALSTVFEQEIFPVLTPQAIDRGRPFPHVSGRSLNLIVVLRSQSAGFRFARVKIPATLPRFVRIPERGGEGERPPLPLSPSVTFTWLEQLVAAHLPRLFPGNEIVAAYPFHVTRDADIELDDEDDDESALDLLSTMSASLTQRQFGPVVRLMVNGTVPTEVRDWLVEHLGTSERDLYVVTAPIGLEDLMELTRLDRPDLKDPPYTSKPLFPPSGPVRGEVNLGPDAALDSGEVDVFARIREGDILVHHPYQSFSAVTDFIRAASVDQDVVAIKQTLYRLGKDSPLPAALMQARDDDTQVAVLVEVKARFDEENNITWAKQLEQYGVHVAYGLAGLKTHCKATLVVRRERDRLRRYVHLATGNYNATTARIYEDFGLFTARDDIGNDVSELFNVLTGFAHQDRYRKIWVAPNGLRQDVIEAIKAEVMAHRRSGAGHLIFKMNSLQDPEIVRALYAAAREGVKIDLIVRGICCLRPGVPGWSESVRVVSIVGRFLEHSRIFWFSGAGEHPARLYLGSADMMQRNLDRRVEVVFPIEDPALQARVRDEILDAYLRDTINARQLHADGTWRPVPTPEGAKPFDVQSWLMRRY
jgi:polyphosphate kinase